MTAWLLTIAAVCLGILLARGTHMAWNTWREARKAQLLSPYNELVEDLEHEVEFLRAEVGVDDDPAHCARPSLITVDGEMVRFHHPGGWTAGQSLLARTFAEVANVMAGTTYIEESNVGTGEPIPDASGKMMFAEALTGDLFDGADFELESDSRKGTLNVIVTMPDGGKEIYQIRHAQLGSGDPS